MSLNWTQESPAYWDKDKQTIVGGAPDGIFELPQLADGDVIPGDWWRVDDDGTTIGYGWLDVTWGDAEMTLAVHPDHQEKGAGSFILEHLQKEAAAKGINYLYNTVRPTHPDEYDVTRWLKKRNFIEHDDGVLRRPVSS